MRNRALAEVTRADDFIVGDQLVSLLLTQISENKALNAVFSDLFDPEGSEIYLKPAKDYVQLDREIGYRHRGRGGAAPGRNRHRLSSAPGRRQRRPRRRDESGEIEAGALRRARFGYRIG